MLAAIFVFVWFWPSLVVLTSFWKSDEYSHGPLVVALAVLIAWHRLCEAKPVARPAWLGILLLPVAGAMLIVGELSTFNSAGIYGFIVAIMGLFLAFFGKACTRAIFPAFIYLCFAVPLPQLLYVTLSGDFQLMSSTLGVDFLNLLGTSVYQEGNVIDLGTMKLQVVEACSGLRYLFPLMSFGFLAALLMEAAWWKRAVLFLSSVPITIVMNALRIALVGVTADQWGVEMAQGFLHDFEGWSIFVGCLACLLAEGWLLDSVGRPGRFRFDYLGLPRGPLFANAAPLTVTGGGALALTAIAAMTFSSGLLAERPEIISSHESLQSFPLVLGEWHGMMKEVDHEVLDALQVSDYWLADYRQGGKDTPVELYVGYYANQRIGSSSHSPSNCIPGGGWQIVASETKTLPVPWDNASSSMTVTRILIRKGDRSQLVYYWFDERGRDLTEVYSVKWHLFLDSLILHRSDGALIRLVTPIVNAESEDKAEERLIQFLASFQPAMQPYLPQASSLSANAELDVAREKTVTEVAK